MKRKDIEIRRIKTKDKKWEIITVHSKKQDTGIIEEIKKRKEEADRGILLVGGDWNKRTGVLGSWDESSEKRRKSMDTKVEPEGRFLVPRTIRMWYEITKWKYDR